MRVYIEKEVKFPEGKGYVNYIDDTFRIFYVPDVVKSIMASYDLVGNKKKRKMRKMLVKAKEVVEGEGWIIRDGEDFCVREYVLMCANGIDDADDVAQLGKDAFFKERLRLRPIVQEEL
jgi:hypothetical protein